MEYLSTIGGTLAHNLGNLLVTIGEDFMQQKDGPLIRCQAFQEEKKGQGNRFVLFKGVPCRIFQVRCQDGFREPDADILLTLSPR